MHSIGSILSRGWLGPMSSYSWYCRGDIKGSCHKGDWVPWVHAVGTAEVTSRDLVQSVTGFHELKQWVLQGWHQGVLSRGWLGSMWSCNGYCRGDIKGSCPECDWVPWVHTVGTTGVTSRDLVQRVTGFHVIMQWVLQRWHQGVLSRGWMDSMCSCNWYCRGDIKGSCPERNWVPWVHTVGTTGVTQGVLSREWMGSMCSCSGSAEVTSRDLV